MGCGKGRGRAGVAGGSGGGSGVRGAGGAVCGVREVAGTSRASSVCVHNLQKEATVQK